MAPKQNAFAIINLKITIITTQRSRKPLVLLRNVNAKPSIISLPTGHTTSNAYASIHSNSMTVSLANAPKKNASSAMDSPVPGHAPVVLNSQNIKLSYKHMRSESRVENQLTIWDALMTSLTL